MEPSSEEGHDSDLEVVDLPGRNPRMPVIFEAKDHPLHPKSNPGQSYVYYTRPTHERMQELLQAGESMEIPIGQGGELNGLLCLQPGDYLWTRNELGSRDPKDDVPVAWVVGPDLRDDVLKVKLDAARDKFMGPDDKITPDSVEFERLKPRPKPVKKGTRCWTLGSSLEPNTNIEAPCANGKWKGETTEYHKMVRDLVTSSTAMAMEDMSHAPEEVKDVLKSEFDRHGMAPLGYTGNYAYHAVQCNLAYAGLPMEEQMGRYAGIHRDRNDCPGHYSTMITRSRLPKNYRPSRIVLPGLGVFSNLADFVGFTFHGQHEHVGMAPYPLPGTPPSPTAYRFALIHYTPQRMATAKTRQRIGALPNTHAFLNPEMRSSKAEKDILKGLQNDSFANFLRDGLWIMEDGGYVDYVGRAAYQFIRYLLTQTQGQFKFELDPTALAHAITYLDADGNRKSVSPWEMAPSVQDNATDRDTARAASEAVFEEHTFKHGSMIPLFYTQNAWVRAETERRYGGGTGQVASGEADDPEGSGAGGSDQMMDVDPGIDAAHKSYNLRKRKRVDTDVEASEDEAEGIEDSVEDAGCSTGALKARKKGKKAVAARPEDLFKLTRLLSVEALEEEVLELRTELQAIQEIEDEEDEATCEEIRLSIGSATEAIELGGLGNRALKGVSDIKADVQRLERHIAQEENLLRSSRAALIKAQTGLRTWVEGPVTDEIIATAKQARVRKSSSQSWVASLTNAVVDMFVCRAEKRTFKASDYGLDWECDEVEIINVDKGKNMLRGQERTVKAAVKTAVMIVENWVDVERYCDRKQAWFASVVEEVMGEEALSMSLVWRLYRNVKTSHIFHGDKGYRAPTKEDMAPFRTALESHSVLESDHIEGQLFDLYRKLCHNDIAPSEIVKHLPNISPRWNALVQMIEVATMYDNEEEPQHVSPYLKKLLSDPLTYHPLREFSPNRRRCVLDLFSGGGPVSKEAIFSLLVWRALPQVFSWHPDSTMLYSTPADFLAAYRAIMKNEPSEAIVELVERYWKVLEERRWTHFAETSPSFEQCYEHFKPRGYLENRLFPRLSRTNAFDVACDLAYAGFCEPPTPVDIAYHIVHINQGAMSGLKALGLVDGKKKDVETKRAQVHQALMDLGYLLKDVAGYMRDDDDEVPYLPYEYDQVDPMAIEHLLRVFSHARKYLM